MSICYVDIINACHLRCETCVRGRRLLPNAPQQKMPFDRFRQVVAKAQAEGYSDIGLYNWSEPFLHPRIDEYVMAVRAAGLGCDISTTLSFRNREALLERTIRAGLGTMIVSISGACQETHVVNHRRGHLHLVHENLARLAPILREPEVHTRVVLRFLRFAHNRHEQAEVEAQAHGYGIEFEALEGVGDPLTTRHDDSNAETFRERLSNYHAERHFEQPGQVCPLVMDTITLDARGRVMLCCATPSYDFLEIGDYLEESRETLLYRRYAHPMCAGCAFPRRPINDADQAALAAAFHARLGMAAPVVEPLPADPPPVAELPAHDRPLRRIVRRVRSGLKI